MFLSLLARPIVILSKSCQPMSNPYGNISPWEQLLGFFLIASAGSSISKEVAWRLTRRVRAAWSFFISAVRTLGQGTLKLSAKPLFSSV
jgi:hypothetical protein